MHKMMSLIVPILVFSSISYADVKAFEVGEISYREIVRTVIPNKLKACYTISHGSNGLKISCVNVKAIPASIQKTSLVAEITYRKIYSIIDSDLGVTCIAASHGNSGVDIDCSTN